jgi:hypothetical protein
MLLTVVLKYPIHFCTQSYPINMCGRDREQDLPWARVTASMATEDPSGNRRPPQLNETVVGRRSNVQHVRDRTGQIVTNGMLLRWSVKRTTVNSK